MRHKTALEEETQDFLNEDLRQIVDLADQLVESQGGRLDDAAILAVAEATGTSPDLVRVALSSRTRISKQSLLKRLRAAHLSLEPEIRTYVGSAYLASVAAIARLIDAFGDRYALAGILFLLTIAGACANSGLARNERVAALAGGVFGGLSFIGAAVLFTIFRPDTTLSAGLLIPWTIGGLLGGFIAHRLVAQLRPKLGMKDPVSERQELLNQLIEIQDKLRATEQHLVFMSVDVVGSTKMKLSADPLAVEYTFNEFHKYVEAVTRKHGGTVHSTAGDGVTCAFTHPSQAFSAGKNLQVGLVELNQFRNRVGMPLRLRVGIHAGQVLAPSKDDVRSVNFSDVIDIAAHMQKLCPVGGVAISEAAAQFLPGGGKTMHGEQLEAEGVRGWIWQPKTVSATLASPPTPPSASGA